MKKDKSRNTRPTAERKKPRQTVRHKSDENKPIKERDQTRERLRLVVGDPWPEASEHFGNLRGGILIGLFFLSSILVLALAGYAFVNRDNSMILEIWDFVKMFLFGVGGWAIGRTQK